LFSSLSFPEIVKKRATERRKLLQPRPHLHAEPLKAEFSQQTITSELLSCIIRQSRGVSPTLERLAPARHQSHQVTATRETLELVALLVSGRYSYGGHVDRPSSLDQPREAV
jgi:hypothetical protein